MGFGAGSGEAGSRGPEEEVSLVFVDRPPSATEVEKLRLVLSAYQDGSGMLAAGAGLTRPGWRDFERSVAAVFEGVGPEDKSVFDVVLDGARAGKARPGVEYGLSCKMRRELDRLKRDGRVTIEVSNSAGKFWDHLKGLKIRQSNYRNSPARVGKGLIESVRNWHFEASVVGGGKVDLKGSFYLALMWNDDGWYRLFQYALDLPDPKLLRWRFPKVVRKGKVRPGRRLEGSDGSGVVMEWYGESGGQLKYYPLAKDALWASDEFKLEVLPTWVGVGVAEKAKGYFGQLWPGP